MGRHRTKDRHLPKRMYERRGKYYFDSPVTMKWEPLGDDYLAALAAYGRMTGIVKTCRTLSDVFRRYKTEVTPLPLKGRARTKEALDNELRTIDRFDRVFGGLLQDALTQRHLYKYIDERIDDRKEFKHLKKPAPSAARHDVRFLKKVLAKGIKWGAGTVNCVIGLEFDSDPENVADVTDELYDIAYKEANERLQIGMDFADITGLRRQDICRIKLSRDIKPEGILIWQGKTQKPLLLKWTDGLRGIYERALALKPDIPKDYLLRNRKGRPYTSRGFGSMWQKLMRKLTKPGKNGEAPILAERYKFKDLRRKAGTDKAIATSEEGAQELLDHEDVRTTRKHYIAPRGRKPKVVTPVR